MKEAMMCTVLVFAMLLVPVVWAGQGLHGLIGRATQGDVQAKYELGMMYRYGNGVAQDTAQAFEWIVDAANYGHPAAQFVLGHMYSKGEGCRVDYIAAYKWFFLSARLGQEGAFAAGGDVAEMMTLEQLNLAQEQAYAWLGSSHTPGELQVGYSGVSIPQ